MQDGPAKAQRTLPFPLPPSLTGRYIWAVAAVAAGSLLRWALPDSLGPSPYLAFYPAVVAAAALGGLGPGLLATLLATLTVNLFFDATPGTLDYGNPVVLLRQGVFAAGGVGISMIAGLQRSAHRHQVENQGKLRESEARYRTLFESIDQGFCIIQMFFDEQDRPVDYRFLEINPAFVKQTGMASALGKRMRELAPQHEEHWFATYGRVALTGEPTRFEAQARELGRWYDVYAFRYGQAQNRQVAILFQDITSRKATEVTIQRAYRDAEEARRAAEEASRAKDHFLAVLSHELRNPLTPVLATASLLQEDPRWDSDTREHLEVIRRNAELEARLIDDLLDVTRITRGKVDLNRQPTPLDTILRHAVEVCRPDIEAHRLHFGLVIKDPPHIVHADAGRLQQVFWNLIKNAVKFTPREGCVGVRCWREDQQVIIEVSDSGVGIAPEALGRVFNAFEQEERSSNRRFGGLGLGLAISKAMVALHDGTIQVRSDGRDRGATFTVRLPLVPADVSAVTPAEPSAPSSAEIGQRASMVNCRVLLVEDHGDTSRIMVRLLTQRGHQVHAAGDVATAIDLAGKHHFDLLLSDLGLPDGSGLDLIRMLRQRGYNFPAIALSGYGQDLDVKQSLAAGFDRHLTKPVDLDRLSQTIVSLTHSATPQD